MHAVPRGILRLDAADLVATAGAGTTLAELDAALAAHGAWVALDPPGGRSHSLAATLGSGTPGPLAALYGPPRDQVIGLSFTAGGGTTVRTGGRVVKNVAGFDLAKLVVGGHGAFGAITEAHLRLRARPEADVTRAFTSGLDQIAAATARLMQGGAMLAACEVLSPALAHGLGLSSSFLLMVRAHGTGVGVAEELDAAAAAVGECREVMVEPALWDRWSDAVGHWPASARIGADPSRWKEAAALAARHGASAFSATVPRGTLRAGFPPGAARQLGALRADAAREGWPVTVERADDDTLREAGIWGAMEKGSLRIAQSLRRALGPEGTHDIPLWVP